MNEPPNTRPMLKFAGQIKFTDGRVAGMEIHAPDTIAALVKTAAVFGDHPLGVVTGVIIQRMEPQSVITPANSRFNPIITK